MNARLILASAAVVLASISAAEILKPAEAHAIGEKVAAVQDASDQIAALSQVVSGVPMSKEFKAKALQVAQGKAKNATERQYAELLLTGIEKGRPDASEFKRLSFGQLLAKARTDLSAMQNKGGKATADLAEYENNKDKRLYVGGAPEVAKALNNGPLKDGGWGTRDVSDWGDGFMGGTQAWVDKDVEGMMLALSTALGGGGLTGWINDMFDFAEALKAGDWVAAGVALANMAAWLISFASAGVGLAIGLVAQWVGIIWDIAKPGMPKEEGRDQARKLRDKTYRQFLEQQLRTVDGPRLVLGFYKAEQQAMYAAALVEAAIEQGVANSNLTPDMIAKSEEERRKTRSSLDKKIYTLGAKALSDTGAAWRKHMSSNSADQTLGHKKTIGKAEGQALPQLADKGITKVTGVMRNPHDSKKFWIFSDDKVSDVTISDKGDLSVTSGPTPLSQHPTLKPLSERGFTTVTGSMPSSKTNGSEVYVFGPNGKYARVNVWTPGQVEEVGDVKNKFPGGLNQVNAVIPAGMVMNGASDPAFYVLNSGNWIRQIAPWKSGQISPSTSPVIARDHGQQPINHFDGIKSAGLSSMTGSIQIPGSNIAYVFDGASVAKVAINGDSTGPATPLADFTGSWVDTNIAYLRDKGYLDGYAGKDMWEKADGLKRDLIKDKDFSTSEFARQNTDDLLDGGDGNPNADNGRPPLGTPQKRYLAQRIPAYPAPPVAGTTYTITARHSGKALDADQHNQRVVQYDPNGAKNQKWTLIQAKAGYMLKDNQSGKCMTANTNVDLADCSVNRDWALQQFDITNTGYGYKIVSRKVPTSPGQVYLDIKEGGQHNGALATLWTPHQGNNQIFDFTPDASTRGIDTPSSAEAPPVSVNSFGNDYTAKPGDILGKDGRDGLKAKVLCEGEPAKDVEVEFAVPADSGLYFKDADGKHVTTVTVTTDDNGEAVAQPLHAGDKEGDFKVTMTAVNEPGATEGEHPSGTYTVHVKK